MLILPDGNSEKKRLAEFESRHGKIVWDGKYGAAPDGAYVFAESLGYNVFETDPPAEQLKTKKWYWKTLATQRAKEFTDLKRQCLTDLKDGDDRQHEADKARLETLQAEALEAARQYDLLEHPPGPDVKQVAFARKLFAQREQLGWDNEEAAQVYRAAEAMHGVGSPKLAKLGDRWFACFEAWEVVNARYLKLPEAVRKEAEHQLDRERREAKKQLRISEIESIEL